MEREKGRRDIKEEGVGRKEEVGMEWEVGKEMEG
jgi:hypothetical protein